MELTKRQYLPHGLWIVATPLGNLEDFSQRGRQALEQANLIVCEDTRRTGGLLSALGISGVRTRLERLDEHTASQKLNRLAEYLQEGNSIALVTDAGTPCISDPGWALVSAAHQLGVRVTPIPGPSAVIALLSVSGFASTAFTFLGFFPRKKQDQKQELQKAYESPMARIFVWYESPLRIEKTLLQIADQFPEAEVRVGKELTKIHERLFFGLAPEAFRQVQQELEKEGSLGEWCFCIQFPVRHLQSSNIQSLNTEENWLKTIRCMLRAGVTVSETALKVSQEFGISKNQTYQAALEIKSTLEIKA